MDGCTALTFCVIVLRTSWCWPMLKVVGGEGGGAADEDAQDISLSVSHHKEMALPPTTETPSGN
jgi:hypothetical protein